MGSLEEAERSEAKQVKAAVRAARRARAEDRARLASEAIARNIVQAKDERQAHKVADVTATNIRYVRKYLALLWRTIDVDLEDRYAERFADLAAPGTYAMVRDDNREQLLSLLREVGVRDRTFLDIGCGRSGGQSLFLARRLGWRGTFVDVSPVTIEHLRKRLVYLPDVQVLERRVTPENVNELAGDLDEIDLLNIDIDSYDYWVWRALRARPRLAVIEYNSYLGHEPVVVPRGAIAEDAPKGYCGASLAALEKLGREKGYLLLGCDRMGVNAYFGRADLLPADAGLSAKRAWRPNLNRLTTDDESRDAEKILARILERGLPLESV
jgi:hypothetical protein